MPNKHALTIIDLERHDIDGMIDVVKSVRWQLTTHTSDGSVGVKHDGWLQLEPPTPQAQIPFENLTKQAVLGWVNAHANFDLVEAKVRGDNKLNKIVNPKPEDIKNGKPSAWTAQAQ